MHASKNNGVYKLSENCFTCRATNTILTPSTHRSIHYGLYRQPVRILQVYENHLLTRYLHKHLRYVWARSNLEEKLVTEI